MAGTKEIKRRIKSVKNTKKITKAMELVAASKMKRAVSNTLASRLYAEYSWEILTSIAQSVEDLEHPLFTERNRKENEKKKILLLLITSNRGLCGAYNAQIMRTALNFLKTNKKAQISLGSVGKKGEIFINRTIGFSSANFILDGITLADIEPIAKYVINEYKNLTYDKVLVVYTDFVSALTQRANIKQVLPVNRTDLKNLIEDLAVKPPIGGLTAKSSKIDYLFEGDKMKLVGSLAEKLTRMQIYQMVTESNASEQSSRMVAMKNASEASSEMIDDLTLMFNKARQANITREISEISAGMASVS
ncbi:ATP synthase F1 subunit gamma [Candidatus Nomurabacteria bacterium RIFCSPLOWO2_02_FULL_40_10]|uniref:ATP synthase gamma chain n=2 Tax=Candidatus Nomuraibacteriota TaxID=1752729 RepID=A0A1F6XZI6_9BACT|nr:MAG: ATP synthase F1 subunit gamma [Candidatus Nomurabacteria bacterium RIFCSPHIGHO2_01_FULL_39_10]OGI99557.1 MAG: ATP synthase F1 subunit gamma [Candidatus Nomurabacteria bacterium RIFCSPLOWO2_02_FULL_40_10]